jgi:gamma-glutamyltranspeptidase / glutathione hydrolase
MVRRAIGMTLFVSMAAGGAASADRTQGRSMVIAKGGIVATEHPLASQAGASILTAGGNAVDAAVAANAVMGLVAPMSNGIGGDLFALVYDAKTKKTYGLNASGWAPKGLTLERLQKAGHKEMPSEGIDAVTVPGAVDGWSNLLQRFGRKSLADVLAPAIRHADEGVPVTEWVGGLWEGHEKILKGNAAALYLPGGRAPNVGEAFRNPDLAKSLRAIAASGRDAFYKGPIAEAIVAESKAQGGTMEGADLAEFESEWVEPISTTYRGWTVYEIPPNTQGIAALIMLNIMEGQPVAEWGHNTARSLHYLIEAKKLAYADMLRYVADPRVAPAPVARLLSKDYAKERAKRIDPAKANAQVSPGDVRVGNDTVYLTTVDAEGNMVSLIQSNYESYGFGSGLVAAGTGFCLHNRGALFSIDPKSPNVVAPRKRPLHTIIPAMMERDSQRIGFGIMGGFNQAQAHAQFVSNVVDHGMNIQAAMEAARFNKPSFEGVDVQVEDRVAPEVKTELERLGHKVTWRHGYSSNMGGGQAVMRDYKAGVNYGASDPRKDGAAVPQQ